MRQPRPTGQVSRAHREAIRQLIQPAQDSDVAAGRQKVIESMLEAHWKSLLPGGKEAYQMVRDLSTQAHGRHAGGIPRTAAVSPDGNWLFAVGEFGAPGGVSLVHLPDLDVKGRWLPDVSLDSVWVSADGQAIYLLTQNGGELRVLRPDGSQIAALNLLANTSGFIVPTIS